MCAAVAQLLVSQFHKCLETRKILCGQLVHVWKTFLNMNKLSAKNLLMIHVGSECNLQLMSYKLATMSCSHTLAPATSDIIIIVIDIMVTIHS